MRRSIVWGQPRKTQQPPDDYFSFAEHDLNVDAIANNDGDLAARRMTHHLTSVYDRILPTLEEAHPAEFA